MGTYKLNNTVIEIPARYRKMNAMPEDPPYSVVLGSESSGTQSFVMAYPIHPDVMMPLQDCDSVINGIHAALSDDQGLISVVNGTSEKGSLFIYSIVKSKQEPAGMQYILTMHIMKGNTPVCIQGFFSEVGMTGMRDSVVFSMLQQSDFKIANDWMRDPYDRMFSKGIQMNLSESEQYDVMFPEHPLSEARRFVAEILCKN